mmetsp:Transcript_43769/g.59804  ORF Transcript_43769/g.59804 Transcript_43769/m.59804 type:complete len:84 (-) Transcript_43769:688-939(-)
MSRNTSNPVCPSSHPGTQEEVGGGQSGRRGFLAALPSDDTVIGHVTSEDVKSAPNSEMDFPQSDGFDTVQVLKRARTPRIRHR